MFMLIALNKIFVDNLKNLPNNFEVIPNRGEDKDVRITECLDIRSECLSGCLCGCPKFEIFFPLKFFSFFFLLADKKFYKIITVLI